MIAAGFSIYLEHILPYKKREEKGVMQKPPIVQLGGGAFNIIKTLAALGMKKKDLHLFCLTGKNKSPDGLTMDYLLQKENITYSLLPFKDRPNTSYYLIPKNGTTWAFGDSGGRLSLNFYDSIKNNANIKILSEVTEDMVILAEKFFNKTSNNQISILIPTVSLLRSYKLSKILKKIDLLALNKKEAEIFFKKPLTTKKILSSSVPNIFITDGPNKAYFKAGGKLYTTKPRLIKNPRFINGAGDAATAALVYTYFYQKKSAAEALKFSLEIGRKTLLSPLPYFNYER